MNPKKYSQLGISFLMFLLFFSGTAYSQFPRQISMEGPFLTPLQGTDDEKDFFTQAGILQKPLPEFIFHEDAQGAINFLPYEMLEGKGTRFHYSKMEGETAGHFWFLKPQDLRGKTIQIHYSGIVPQEMVFKLSRSSSSACAVYRSPLRNGAETKAVAFKVPDTFPFKDVGIFKFEIERSRSGKTYADFFIRKIEILNRPFQPSMVHEGK
jgi:hypothetical protein